MPFIPTDPACMTELPDANFADTYQLRVTDPTLDAIAASYRMMEQVPRWISALLGLRNVIVSPFGLKGTDGLPTDLPRIGWFPLLSQSPERVVLGLDDKHLDFRLVIDALGNGNVSGTTLVKTHNLLGRTYLRLIMPFHRVIVPRMMQEVLVKPR